MSVANLEAFALAQGIDKAFDRMSQGEQVMLRYQYLMQATSDAQGDFARTSDGFANSLRLLQNNFETLKTTVGSMLLPVITEAVSGLNDILSLLIPETKQTTVLDDFANIDLQTQNKIDTIKATKEEANNLLQVLRDIETATITDKSGAINNMSGAANVLSSTAGTNWSNFISGLNGVDGVITASDGGTQAGTDLGNLATGADKLVGEPVTKFKFGRLPTSLQTLLSKAQKSGDIKDGLETVDESAGELTENEKTQFKYGKLITDIGELETAASGAASNVKPGLENLDSETEDITTKQETGWKFGALEEDLAGLPEKISESATKAETELNTLDGNTTDITTQKDTDFKYTGLEGDLTGFQEIAGTAAEKLPGDLATVEQAAGSLTETGTGAKWKFGAVKTGIDELVDVGNEAVTENTKSDLEAVNEGASTLAGTEENFKYAALTDSTDGVAPLINAANGGTTAGTELENLGTGAQAVADVNYTQGGSIKGMSDDIKLLKSTDADNWSRILNVFKNVPGYASAINSETIKEIAGAFAGLEGDKATAWETLMNALGSDLSALATLTGQDENGAAAWLEGMKHAANGLDNEDVDSWDQLLTKLAAGTPGAGNFLQFSDIYELASAMGVADSMYVQLNGETMTLTEANRTYKQGLKELVQLYPELSDMINLETGEIEGGTDALEERIRVLTEQAEKEAILYGIKQKQAALDKAYANLPSLRVDSIIAWQKVNDLKEGYDQAMKRLKEIGAYVTDEGNWEVADISHQGELIELIDGVVSEYEEAVDAANEATRAYNESQKAYDETSASYDKLTKSIEGTTKAQSEGTETAKEYEQAQKDAAKKGVEALTDALKEMNDYVERTRDSTKSSIDSALSGFKSFETSEAYLNRLKKEAGNEAAKIQEEINKATEDGKGTIELEMKLTGAEDNIPTLEKLKTTFEDNLTFIQEYQKNLEEAKRKGASDEFLAEFADFSQENAAYLHLLSQASGDEVKKVSKAYDDMAAAKKPLTDSLTEIKLKADEEFNELVAKAKQAAIDLNNGDIAKESMASTVQGIVDGIKAKVPEVKEAVDALNAELARLGETNGLNIYGGLNGSGINLTFGTGEKVGSHANGLDYVPFNNYLSYLHEGEAVLTAEEAAVWRNFKNGGSGVANTIDYGQLSGAIWENAPSMGGNVYLDGRTVGRVISAQQANSYRALERSGWQG